MRHIPDKVRARLREIIGANESVGRLAAAWAVGVAIGLSPLLGLHTVLALVIAFAFRLNKLDVLLGTLVVNPWTFPPYFFAAVATGRWITRVRVPRFVLPDPSALLHAETWREQAAWLLPLLGAWGAGAALFAAVGGAATYIAARALITSHRRRRLEKR